MTYFKIREAHKPWLDIEIAKGTIFYSVGRFSRYSWISCGEYQEGSLRYGRLTADEVIRMIKKNKNVYWRN